MTRTYEEVELVFPPTGEVVSVRAFIAPQWELAGWRRIHKSGGPTPPPVDPQPAGESGKNAPGRAKR